MKPHYTDDRVTLYHGDCVEVMRTLPDASVDSVVTDPPYGLEFMGKEWDKLQTAQWRGEKEKWQEGLAENHIAHRLSKGPRYGNEPGAMQEWHSNWATEALRVLKPGGHLLAFGGTRTWHRLAVAIEDAGFEVRDSIAWMYGSGFPKSHDVSKGIDKAAGAQREVVGVGAAACEWLERGESCPGHGDAGKSQSGSTVHVPATAPATPAAVQWQGWGTALKPAFEPIVVARKTLIGTVAVNVLTHGTGALNIDGCRIGTEVRLNSPALSLGNGINMSGGMAQNNRTVTTATGRWPANVILDESQAEALDAQSGVTDSAMRTGQRTGKDLGTFGRFEGQSDVVMGHSDTGGASRFFYTAKANSSERPNVDGVAHPTVKPLDLMRYLVRLVTPPGGTVLEPFAGSGTTAEACIIEGFKCIAIEMTDEYLPLILDRITKPIETVMF